jgi:bifunctional UDP-N-acetylglucosamine pyrophosphorylase/glucosamine-1-phosphate N-acetyltransferase
LLRRRILDAHMRAGVTIVDPERTVIEPGVRLCADVTIEPGCFLRGATTIGEGTIIGPYTIIEDSTVGRDCTILQSWVSGTTIGARVRVGPFARLRPGTALDCDVFIGNFVETKATSVGAGSDIHHVAYLGDAVLGTNVNIGAGTITCNYDGVRKHATIIGNDVFVGCDTMLIAPVELGNGSRTGAGAVVTRSVPAGQTVVGVPARTHVTDGRAQSREEHGR